MSFNVILKTGNSTDYISENTVGKDYTWGFDFSQCEPGTYEMRTYFNSGNIALATFSTNGVAILNVNIGQNSPNKLGARLNTAITTVNVGPLRLDWKSATVGQYVLNSTDLPCQVIKNLNTSANTIRIHIDQLNGAIIGTGVTGWCVVLEFKKL
jgi:hypothetical protein